MTALVLFAAPPHAPAAQRTALVIGNGEYLSGRLRNPANDARSMSEALAKAGFTVTTRIDAGQRAMEDAIRAFGRSLRDGGVGLFYFAGHGLQVGGANYLVPVDARIETEADVKFECVDAGRVLAQMETAANGLNIVILDACRNNPYARGFRSGTRGLARMDAPKGSIVAFATAPGGEAADGAGDNGVFTQHLVRNILTPGLEVLRVLRNTRIAVDQETGGRQTPWDSNSLMGDFYFMDPPSGTAAAAPQPQPASPAPSPSPTPSASSPVPATSPPPVELAMAPRPQQVPAPSEHNQGDAWTDPATGMAFVWVPGGCFQMGSDKGKPDEKPVHEVCVNGFWMGKYEVTQAEWQSVMGNNPSHFKGERNPVEMVSWNDAQSFIRTLNEKGSGSFRLPTEAEWEYAAQNGGTSITFAKRGYEGLFAWYRGNSEYVPHSVGGKAPNGFGLYDMSGNVWEWCQDWYGKNYYAASPRTAPPGPGEGTYRVYRGGSWYEWQEAIRWTRREGDVPSETAFNLGFRLLRTE